MTLVRIVAVLSAASLLAVGGCAAAHATSPPGPVPASGLIGSWSVTEAADAPAGTVLVLNAQQDLQLGDLYGSWKAGAGAFVADVHSRSGNPGTITTPRWLAAASRAESTGSEVVLRTVDGSPTARLVPQGGQRPSVPDEATALPGGLRPAERAELVGHWVPADGSGMHAPKRPSIALAADGSYTGTDGCNGTGGRWASAPGGVLIATSGLSTLMGCEDMLGVPGWLGAALHAGFDGDVLVLVDAAGKETGRLRQIPTVMAGVG